MTKNCELFKNAPNGENASVNVKVDGLFFITEEICTQHIRLISVVAKQIETIKLNIFSCLPATLASVRRQLLAHVQRRGGGLAVGQRRLQADHEQGRLGEKVSECLFHESFMLDQTTPNCVTMLAFDLSHSFIKNQRTLAFITF